MEKFKDSKISQSKFKKFLDRRRSFPFSRIQSGASSRMDPTLVIVKSLINASASVSHPLPSNNSVPWLSSPLALGPITTTPVHQATAPLTIFYNGSVSVFAVPRDEAENILKVAVEISSKSKGRESVAIGNTKREVPSCDDQQKQLLHLDILKFNNGVSDLPIARKKSLQRFLQKRKERLITASPYAFLA